MQDLSQCPLWLSIPRLREPTRVPVIPADGGMRYGQPPPRDSGGSASSWESTRGRDIQTHETANNNQRVYCAGIMSDHLVGGPDCIFLTPESVQQAHLWQKPYLHMVDIGLQGTGF